MSFSATAMVRAHVVVVSFMIGLVIGAMVNEWRLNAKMATEQALHAEQISQIVQVAAKAATDALERQRQAQLELSKIDTQRTQELASAQSEINELRTAVAAGERRLRIQATCPDPSSNGVSGSAATASVDDDAGPGLTPAAERNYWTLRERINTVTAQVSGLQDYIRSACLQ